MLPRIQGTRSVAALTLPGTTTRGMAAVALFVAVQIADGILTFAGIARFGPAVESNPLLALSIASLGAGATLSIAKSLAVVFGLILHRVGCHLALALLTVLYVFAAVLPWTSLVLT